MQISISDLLFPGFQKYSVRALQPCYGMEFFYEFGKDYYWDEEIAAWGERSLSIHGPCVAVNLADPAQSDYLKIFSKTFAYAKKCGAEFVVVHTNESVEGDREKLREMVVLRLKQLLWLAAGYGVKVAIENVGLVTKNNVLFNYNEFISLINSLPEACALLDTGHAHVNGWDLARTVKDLNGRLIACHVHDNDGGGDSHLPVWQGNIDWENYFAAIRQYAPQATLVLEYCCGFKNAAELERHVAALIEKYHLG